MVSQAVVAADFWLSIKEPGKVLDRNVGIDGVPDGYRAMNDPQAIKVMVTP